MGESVGCLYPQDFLRDFFNRHLPFLVALGLSVEHILTKFVENLFLWLSDFTLLVAESQAVFEQVGLPKGREVIIYNISYMSSVKNVQI